MSTLLLESVFGPHLVDAGFERGAASDERVLYVGEVVSERDPDETRDVIVTITGGEVELMTFVARTDRVGYRQLLAVRDDRDQYAQVEAEGSWVLRKRIAAHPSDSAARMTTLVVRQSIAMARYADLIIGRLEREAASVEREFSTAV